MTRRINTIHTKIDADTGEIISESVVTAEQSAGYNTKLQAIADYEAKGFIIRKENVGFVWLLYNTGEVLDLGLKPSNLTRLMYLATFMDYNNYFTDYHGNKLFKENLECLLDIGKSQFYSFFSEAVSLGILFEDPVTGFVKINDNIFIKGSLDKAPVGMNTIRLYGKAIQELYQKCLPREHKILSYVFQAIPFVNVKYNVICFNPDEDDLEFVRPLTLSDYCKIIGQSNIFRTKATLKRITVRSEYVFGFVETGGGNSIFINPRVYYGGYNAEEVRILGKFCKEVAV